MKNFFDELADNIGADIVLGDPPREVSDPRLGTIKVQVTTLQDEIEVSSNPGAPKFNPGNALAGQFSAPRECGGGKTCSGVSLKVVAYKENLLSTDESKQDKDVEIDDSQVSCVLLLLAKVLHLYVQNTYQCLKIRQYRTIESWRLRDHKSWLPNSDPELKLFSLDCYRNFTSLKLDREGGDLQAKQELSVQQALFILRLTFGRSSFIVVISE